MVYNELARNGQKSLYVSDSESSDGIIVDWDDQELFAVGVWGTLNKVGWAIIPSSIAQLFPEWGDVTEVSEGGPGSGHHGHAGRPGQRGGSVSGATGIDGEIPLLVFKPFNSDPTSELNPVEMTREEFKRRWLQSAQTEQGVPVSGLSGVEQQNWAGHVSGDTIRVYRGVDEHRAFMPGDFVTPSAEYARTYGENVAAMDVPVKYLRYVRGSMHGDVASYGVGTMPELIFAPVKTKFHKRYHTYDWDKMHEGMDKENIRLFGEGGPGKGWWGPPSGTHVPAEGAKKIRLTRHAFERTQERTGFGPVRRALKALARMEVPEKEWHTELYRSQGRLAGYLQGFDGRVKTVLGPWYEKGKLSGEEIAWRGLT